MQIPSRLNMNIDFGPIWIWRRKLYGQSRFWSNFDLFSIKFDNFWSLFWLNLTTFWLKDQKRWLKCWLKDQKCKFNWKSWWKLSFSISFCSLSIQQKLSDYICSHFNKFRHDNWFGFQEFGSKSDWNKIRIQKFSNFSSGSIQSPKLKPRFLTFVQLLGSIP